VTYFDQQLRHIITIVRQLSPLIDLKISSPSISPLPYLVDAFFFSPLPSPLRSNRELAFQQLQSTLAKKDFELAKLQQNQSNLVAEISELRRHTKREGVNLDYLKNIVLQVQCLFLFLL
jgi:hypothetical protein